MYPAAYSTTGMPHSATEATPTSAAGTHCRRATGNRPRPSSTPMNGAYTRYMMGTIHDRQSPSWGSSTLTADIAEKNTRSHHIFAGEDVAYFSRAGGRGAIPQSRSSRRRSESDAVISRLPIFRYGVFKAAYITVYATTKPAPPAPVCHPR